VPTLVLLRHGQSTWNAENLFTGWHDVDLTELGEEEARTGGTLVAEAGLEVEIVHTSLQKRAIRTANLALEVLDRLWVPQRRSWRLNERHYGALQGLNKAETLAKYGPEQFQQWRRSYDVPPPPLADDDERHPRHDPRYAMLPPDVLPASECLKDVVVRMLPYWYDAIVPDLVEGRVVLVAAHGNSLRALRKHLDGISDTDIVDLNIPTGIPLVYELDERLRPTSFGYLGDPEAAARAADAVANQAAVSPAAAEPDDPADPQPEP
jgi:2,3-bisphosphoglycerate-dependent phosphoglycerate mutase